MEETPKSFEDLEAYKKCRDFRIFAVNTVARKLVEKREYDLSNQLKDAARSTTANIAEGYGRFHYLDNAKFCSISRGSLYESLEHIITSHDDNLIPNTDLQTARTLFEDAIKPLNGYINYLYRIASKSK